MPSITTSSSPSTKQVSARARTWYCSLRGSRAVVANRPARRAPASVSPIASASLVLKERGGEDTTRVVLQRSPMTRGPRDPHKSVSALHQTAPGYERRVISIKERFG